MLQHCRLLGMSHCKRWTMRLLLVHNGRKPSSLDLTIGLSFLSFPRVLLANSHCIPFGCLSSQLPPALHIYTSCHLWEWNREIITNNDSQNTHIQTHQFVSLCLVQTRTHILSQCAIPLYMSMVVGIHLVVIIYSKCERGENTTTTDVQLDVPVSLHHTHHEIARQRQQQELLNLANQNKILQLTSLYCC